MKTVLLALVILCFTDSLCAASEAPASSPPISAGASQAEEAILAYDRLLRAADRYLSEGDFPAALEQLQEASKLRVGDARFYEKFAIAYDADRQPDKAFEYFATAGEMYLTADELDSAARILEYLRVSGRNPQRSAVFAQRLQKAHSRASGPEQADLP